MYARPIQNLITAFKKLPSVGGRTAERFVFHILKSGKKDAAEITLALKELLENVRSCAVCFDFSDKSPCRICAGKRDSHILCVVGEPQDIQSIEKTAVYTGLYHVLRGNISPDDSLGFEKTKIKELFERIEKTPPQEIILALNPNMEGETTMMFLQKQIKTLSPHTQVTRLARGLPMGSDIEYADEITLQSAFKNRRS